MPQQINSRQNLKARLDFPSVFIYILLVGIGYFNIYSASTGAEPEFVISMKQVYTRQLAWMAGAFLIIILVAFSNPNFFEFTAYVIYGITILLTIAVLFFGREVSGAKSWFGYGGIGIQPSEFAKFGTALALAKFLGGYGVKFKGWKNISIALLLFLLPMAIILKQNDTGSALVFLSFFLVLYREGLPGYFLLAAVWTGVLSLTTIILTAKNIDMLWLGGILAALALLFFLIFRKNKQAWWLIGMIAVGSWLISQLIGFAYQTVLKDYQRDRIEIILELKKDDQGVGFNLIQSKTAIGAGRLFGRGFLQGTQTKMGFVPEQHTDFIFCTIGEEWGFLGITIFFALFFGLLYRLVVLSERQTTNFGRILGYSVTSILFIHVLINIGMTIGLVPIIGIPLPFISAGGSSLLAFTLMLFTFLKVDERRLSYV
jgi:rod shape determining protein RodA